jgi:hypothetical protein
MNIEQGIDEIKAVQMLEQVEQFEALTSARTARAELETACKECLSAHRAFGTAQDRVKKAQQAYNASVGNFKKVFGVTANITLDEGMWL